MKAKDHITGFFGLIGICFIGAAFVHPAFFIGSFVCGIICYTVEMKG